jgi:LysM repeat protein
MATTHKVVKGDTLWGIVEKYLNPTNDSETAKLVKQLASINNIPNPDLIYVGQTIQLTSTGSSGNSSSNSNKVTDLKFGQSSTQDDLLVASWSWDKENTESYKVLWTYDTGDGIWFVGNSSENTVDPDYPSGSQYSTYSIPNNARRVRFKVKPISKKKSTSGNTETYYWTADWSDVKEWTDDTPLATPPEPSDIKIEKYKLTVSLENLDLGANATHIQFQIVKNNSDNVFKTSGKVKIVSTCASYSCTVDAGAEYKVRCRSCNDKNEYSDWSKYSGNVTTMPHAPERITKIQATSKTSLRLEWTKVPNAKTYDIEFTTEDPRYFDGSENTQTKTGIKETHFELTGLSTGVIYFLRVRAVNDGGDSGWSPVSQAVLGEPPAAPTTWSSTTTAVVSTNSDENKVYLYWVHNSKDGSSQTYADLEIYLNGEELDIPPIKNSTDPDEKDKTSVYEIITSKYPEGAQLRWRVRTAGVTNEFGEWSVDRTIDLYAPPTLELIVSDAFDNPIGTSASDTLGGITPMLTSYPIRVKALARPTSQKPTGYHVSIVANEGYESTDEMGNPTIVKAGQEVYSKFFDIQDDLSIEISAGDINLYDGSSYSLICTASLNSGLNAVSSVEFSVLWLQTDYSVNAEIGVDFDTYTATIRPYCDTMQSVYYLLEGSIGDIGGIPSKPDTPTDPDDPEKVERGPNGFTRAKDSSGNYITLSYTPTDGHRLASITTDEGDQVWLCTSPVDGEQVHYVCRREYRSIENTMLSVYRREFDGSFTEIATGLPNTRHITVTDPHPALDFARYRIVSTAIDSGRVVFYDPPGYPIRGEAVILQWDENWSSFETTEDAVMVQPPWSGSLLKLPYNVDVSDSTEPDVELVKYIGRANPVSYYGTQIGHKATWNMVIERDDVETLYTLRRLSKWIGDVYVREPSGSGYWANVTVSLSQKHMELTIPVTLSITRVEGGI